MLSRRTPRPPTRRIAAPFLAIIGATLIAPGATLAQPKDGVAFQSEALAIVEDRTEGIRPEERDAMFGLLEHARRTDYQRQLAAAKRLLAERRRRMPEFADRPDSQLLVEDMLRVPDDYRGKPVTLTGYVYGATERDASHGEDHLPALFQLRLYTEAGNSSPAEVFALTLPEDWPSERPVIDDVQVTGFFFKVFRYSEPQREDSQPGTAAVAPVILAQRVEWNPRLPAGEAKIDPSLWSGVRHMTPISRSERDLYYRVLKHARDTDYNLQQAEARRTLRDRIRAYLNDAEAEYESAKRRAARYPRQSAEYERRLEAARSAYRRKLRAYQRYREHPAEFPTYLDLFQNYEAYEARPVTLRGRLRQLVKSPSDNKVRYDFGNLYEAWIYTEDSQNHPSVVVSTSVPEELLRKARREGDKLDEPVSMTGYFLKMYAYQAQDTDRFAPMFLAQQIQWHPVPQEPEPIPPVYVYLPILVIVGAVFAFIWKTRREDRRHRERLRARQHQTDYPDLANVVAGENPNEATFDGIEAAEDPHFRDYGRHRQTSTIATPNPTPPPAGAWLVWEMQRLGDGNSAAPYNRLSPSSHQLSDRSRSGWHSGRQRL